MTIKNKVKKLEEKWDNADKWLKRIISIGGSIVAISGACIGAFNWGFSQINREVVSVVSQEIAALSAEVKKLKDTVDKTSQDNKLATTRLELNTLISHNPTNILEIEKAAKYYFLDLGGDWYMSQIYSDWAKKYGGDTSFVTHK